jgi:hypothetical protein
MATELRRNIIFAHGSTLCDIVWETLAIQRY